MLDFLKKIVRYYKHNHLNKILTFNQRRQHELINPVF